MREKALIKEGKLLPSEYSRRRERDIAYLMELKEENLLFPYYMEAGLNGRLNYRPGPELHGGWDSPLSQIRGTFTGHWLSAAARLYQETGDSRLKAKADYITAEIGRCQEANGGEWAFPIPEKYLYGLKEGRHFWAPQYVCHKVMMGLLDMYQYAGNSGALTILRGCADWFCRFTRDIRADTMADMMDREETGGIMELWADLYDVTGDPRHLELMRRYERTRLTGPLLEGRDVLTNMHANATIPEIHGCARAYEVTGEQRYWDIAESYWRLAVEERMPFATGGQTDAEVWTPRNKQAARLSDMNQEHCVVYNMIRLADYLYRFSGEKKYQDYIELNLHNGLLAQGFWEARALDGALEPHVPDSGIVCYYLPLAPGSVKKWGRKTEDFWCCHCTAVQANARYREWIWYQDQEEITAAQYIPSEVTTQIGNSRVTLTMKESDLGGNYLQIFEVAEKIPVRPEFSGMDITVSVQEPTAFVLRLRSPWWLKGKARIFLDGEKEIPYSEKDGYLCIERKWEETQRLTIELPKGLTSWPLVDEEETVAFLDGPVLLAGLTPHARMLYGNRHMPERLLAADHEREWEAWKGGFRTVGQDKNFRLIPLKEIGRECYTVYFPVKEREGNNKA